MGVVALGPSIPTPRKRITAIGAVGAMVGVALGAGVGEAGTLADGLGSTDGDGEELAPGLGDTEGSVDGEALGDAEALELGDPDGLALGERLGLGEGVANAKRLGEAVGWLWPGRSAITRTTAPMSATSATANPALTRRQLLALTDQEIRARAAR